MPQLPIAVTGDEVDPKYGPPNVIASITPTVLAGGKPVATAGAIVAPHGNYNNPKAPGFNPECANSTVEFLTSTSVFVNGEPVALAGPPGTGSQCSCSYHSVMGPGVPTVIIGR